MKLTDFYSNKKVTVTSVNSKTGDVILNASDINAISNKDIGVLVPNLNKAGIVPDSQLPNYVKLVNGKISGINLPVADKHKLGCVILGDGFVFNLDGSIDAIGIISEQQKKEKIDIIKTDGAGYSVLTDKGEYAQIRQLTQQYVTFDELNENNDVVFDGNIPLIGLLSQTNKYYVLITQDIQFVQNQTILHMNKFLQKQQIESITGQWKAFICSAIKYIDVNQISQQYKKFVLNNALIFG